MRKVFRAIRFSSVGVFFTGIIGVIQGCSVEREGALFAALLFLLNFCSGPIIEETTATSQITMYDGGTSNGNLGGRAGADATCTAAAGGFGLDGKTIRAYISVDVGDDLDSHLAFPDLPLGIPIKSTTGKTIANDWADALDGSIAMNLQDADILPVNTFWWSGSDPGGETQLGAECDVTGGWTDEAGEDGRVGDSSVTTSNWITDTIEVCVSGAPHLLCVAY